MTRLRILIVEDEPLIARVLSRLLREHDVHAVATLRELAGLGDAFDVAFCDLALSDGCSLDELHAVCAHKVVLMSGAAPPASAQQRIDTGELGWLPKPFHRDQLLAHLAA